MRLTQAGAGVQAWAEVTSVAMFGTWLAILSLQNGDMQAWRVSCIDPQRPTIERLWPKLEQSQGQAHGVGRIVECFPEECRFITASKLSTGMVEWFATLDGGELVIRQADQLSRDADLLSRVQGQGEILPVTACTYLRGSSCVAVTLQGEINVMSVCPSEQQQELLRDYQPSSAPASPSQAHATALGGSPTLGGAASAVRSPLGQRSSRSLGLSDLDHSRPRSAGAGAHSGDKMREAVVDRVDAIHVLRTLDVIPTPYTVRFSSKAQDQPGINAELKASELLSEQEVGTRLVSFAVVFCGMRGDG